LINKLNKNRKNVLNNNRPSSLRRKHERIKLLLTVLRNCQMIQFWIKHKVPQTLKMHKILMRINKSQKKNLRMKKLKLLVNLKKKRPLLQLKSARKRRKE
jgi:hypothetical protein